VSFTARNAGYMSAQLADSDMGGYIAYGGRFDVNELTSTLGSAPHWPQSPHSFPNRSMGEMPTYERLLVTTSLGRCRKMSLVAIRGLRPVWSNEHAADCAKSWSFRDLRIRPISE
jgi:hypothetical protein